MKDYLYHFFTPYSPYVQVALELDRDAPEQTKTHLLSNQTKRMLCCSSLMLQRLTFNISDALI